MPLVEQELLTLQEHLSSPPVFCGVHVTRLVLCEVFCRSLFVLFLLAIVLSGLQFTDSDYPFGILKLFLYNNVVLSLDYTKIVTMVEDIVYNIISNRGHYKAI
jgi:hypothetical protein